MIFQQTKLDNGFEIVAETHSAAYSAALGFFVRTGARNEPPDRSGVSHFLEHMVFKGNNVCRAEDVNRRLDEIGADVNAYTSEEQTVYYATLLPEVLEEAVYLLGGLLRPALRVDDFETEKQVILEEINMYEDQPPFGADDRSREFFFAGHPLGNSVLGTPESVSGLTLEVMRDYLTRHYCPENITLVATGRLDFDRLLRTMETICEDWPNPAPLPEPELRRISGRRGEHRLVREAAAQQYTLLLSDAPSCRDADRFAAGLLANIIGDDVGSRLYWDLVDTGLADGASLSVYEYLDNGLFLTGIACEPEATDTVLDRVRRVFQDAMRDGPTQEELDRAKNKVLSRLVLSNERPAGRLFAIGSEWAAGNGYRTVRQDLDAIRAISLNDLRGVLERYPLSDPLLVSMGPTAEFKNPFGK